MRPASYCEPIGDGLSDVIAAAIRRLFSGQSCSSFP
jgi:hypothetical protein